MEKKLGQGVSESSIERQREREEEAERGGGGRVGVEKG